MARLIDADALLESKWWNSLKDDFDKARAKIIVQSCPTVDAVPVVRCKDCKHQIKEWHTDNRMISKGYYTYGCDRNFHRYSSNAVNGRDNEFCSYGERRSNV